MHMEIHHYYQSILPKRQNPIRNDLLQMKVSPMDFCCFKWMNKNTIFSPKEQPQSLHLLDKDSKEFFSIVIKKCPNRNMRVIISPTIKLTTYVGKTPTKFTWTALYSSSCTTLLCLYWQIGSEHASFINFIKSLVWYSLFWKALLSALRGKKIKIGHCSSKFQNVVNCYFKACSNNFGD